MKVSAVYVLDVAIKVGFPILLGMASWAHLTLRDHESRLTRIESTNYSQKDAMEDRSEIVELLRDIRDRQAATNERLVRLETKLEVR